MTADPLRQIEKQMWTEAKFASENPRLRLKDVLAFSSDPESLELAETGEVKLEVETLGVKWGVVIPEEADKR